MAKRGGHCWIQMSVFETFKSNTPFLFYSVFLFKSHRFPGGACLCKIWPRLVFQDTNSLRAPVAAVSGTHHAPVLIWDGVVWAKESEEKFSAKAQLQWQECYWLMWFHHRWCCSSGIFPKNCADCKTEESCRQEQICEWSRRKETINSNWYWIFVTSMEGDEEMMRLPRGIQYALCGWI